MAMDLQYSLPTLLKRLEAATSRLEDIAMAQGPALPAVSGASAVNPYAAAAPAPAAAAGGAAPATPIAPSAPAAPAEKPSVKAYGDLVEGPLATYIELSEQLGGVTATHAQLVAKVFVAQKAYIRFASECTKVPMNSPLFGDTIKPMADALNAVTEFREKNRSAVKEKEMLSTVSEGIPALGWVTVEPKPAPYVAEMKDACQFYANRAIKEFKETNPKVVEWARSFVTLLEDLRKYVMQFHTTGVAWNAKGIDPATYNFAAAASTSGPSAAGAPPPPPPPPPAPPAAPAAPPAPAPPAPGAPAVAAPSPAGGMANVFAELNKGDAITSGLKKVDKSEMTHKNPELRASGTVPSSVSSTGKGPQKPPKPSSFQKKPPKTELDGKKWKIENHENNNMILIDQTEINQIINVFNVKSSVIQIKGKVNAVSLANCTKVSILLDSTVSSLEISNSPSFTVQVLGKVPTILIDGTDGGQVYLSKESLDVEIVTAKSSSINISLPVPGEEEGIFEEKAVPEQLKTVVKDGKLVTTVVEHSG